MRAAVILAGGFGTRFGDSDKATAPVAGRPMLRWVVEAVAPGVDDLVVNARRDQRERIAAALGGLDADYAFAADPVPDRGPLAGMATGLGATDAEASLVVACDMPLVDPAFVEALFDRIGDADAAVPVERGGDETWLQPLQAVYRTRKTAAVATAALEAGIDSPIGALERLRVERVDPADVPGVDAAWTLRNVNTEAERREVAGRLRRRASSA